MSLVRSSSSPLTLRRGANFLGIAAAVAMLAACGGGDKKGATQVAAKVNKEEISVHQINFVLQRQPGLKPEQAKAASKQILETLIDQELAIQQATENKLDREPNVVMAIEGAKREILARAYADKLAATASKPTDEDVAQYYNSKPSLFAQRRVYVLQEFNIEASGEAANVLGPIAQASKSSSDLAKQLTAANIKFNTRQISQPAENLPLTLIDRIGALSDGQSLTLPTPTGVNVVFVNSAKSQPVALAQARPAIEQFLLNDRKRKIMTDEIKRLRAAASVTYEGQFVGGPNASASAASQ